MPEEIVAIIIVSILATFGAAITITKIVVNYLERRSRPPTDSSLTQGELRELISSAVAEATAPMEVKLADLQKQVGPAEGRTLLAGPEERETETPDRP